MKRLLRIPLKILLWFFIITIGLTLMYRWLSPPITPLMVIRLFEQMSDGKEMKLQKKWQPLQMMSPHLPVAVIASEDQKFEDHFGFDLEAIEKATKYNEKHQGKKLRGASTISQQTAKNVFLVPSRSIIRKAFEAYFTFLIEILWKKERIMEVYLNVIEMGDGIYGAEAASRHYFRKSSANLTREESALIAAILPNPRKWSVTQPSLYVTSRKNWILRNMPHLEKKS
jgi:monofunctional glycosyltransferase